MDRGAWRAAVHRATKSQSCSSNTSQRMANTHQERERPCEKSCCSRLRSGDRTGPLHKETGPSGGHSHPERLRATQHTRRTRDAGTSRTERETTVTAGDSNTSLSARTELLKSNASNHTALNTAFSRLSSQHTQKAPSSPCSPRHPRVTHRHTPEARTPRQPMFWVTEQTPANSQELKPSTVHPLTVMESQKSRTES